MSLILLIALQKRKERYFHLESEPSGYEAFWAFIYSPKFGNMSKEASEEAQSSAGEESEAYSTLEPIKPESPVPDDKMQKSASDMAISESSTTNPTAWKRQGDGKIHKNGNRAQPKLPNDVKTETKQSGK